MGHKRRGHGEGSVYQRADGYWVGAVEAGRCRGGHPKRDGSICTGGERRKVRVVRRQKTGPKGVLQAVREVQQQVENGVVPDRSRTVAAYLTWWLDEVIAGTVTDGTMHDYRSRVKRVTVVVGHVRLGKLTGAHVQHLANRLAETYPRSPRTQQHTLTTFRQALRWAVGADILNRNPAEAVSGPKIGAALLDDTLTDDEAKLVLAAGAKGPSGDTDRGEQALHLTALWWLAINYGLRKGELMALRWRDIDFTKDEMTVRRSATKSDAGHRTLPLIPEAKHVLVEHRRFGAGKVAPLDGWVFCRPDGRALYHQLVDRRWNTLLTTAGIEHMCRDCDSDEKCSTSVRRFHVSRHTAATLLLEAGVPLEVVSAILGHANLNITADIYAKVRGDLKRRGLSALHRA
jgi:integrase